MADRVCEVMTEEMRETILRLKFETPVTEKIIGVKCYRAVFSGGVRSYAELEQWRRENPALDVVEWIP